MEKNMKKGNIYLSIKLPWWLSSKESACQCRRRRFKPWVRRIPWQKKMATHSSICAWEIPWTKEPGGLEFMVSQIVRHDLVTKQRTSRKSSRQRHHGGCKFFSTFSALSFFSISPQAQTYLSQLSHPHSTLIWSRKDFRNTSLVLWASASQEVYLPSDSDLSSSSNSPGCHLSTTVELLYILCILSGTQDKSSKLLDFWNWFENKVWFPIWFLPSYFCRHSFRSFVALIIFTLFTNADNHELNICFVMIWLFVAT